MNTKRIKIILISMIAALLLTGAAYAAWTDSVDINTQASTAEMKIEITDKALLIASPLVEFTADDIVIAADKKSADVSIGNNYPGSEIAFAIKIDNNGSIPVKMTEVYHNTRYVVNSITGHNHGKDPLMFYFINAEYQIAVFDSNGVTTGMTGTENTETANDWEVSYFVDNSLPAIEPGGYAALMMRVYFSSNADNTIMNKDFVFRVTPIFEQAS